MNRRDISFGGFLLASIYIVLHTLSIFFIFVSTMCVFLLPKNQRTVKSPCNYSIHRLEPLTAESVYLLIVFHLFNCIYFSEIIIKIFNAL